MKIWKKALLYVMMMTFIIVVLNHIVPNPYEGQREKVADVAEHPSQYKSLTFGRSHAGSLDYDYYRLSGVNYSLGGRDLASIEYMCDYLLPKCDSLQEIIIFISYTSLYFDNTAMSQGNLNDARKALYYSVPLMRPVDMGDINNFIFGKFFTFIQADHGWSLIKNTSAGTVEMANEHAKEGGALSEEEMVSSGEKQSTRDILDRRTASRYNPNVAIDNEDRLRNIITKCQKYGVRVKLVQAPYYFTYVERVPKDMIMEVNDVVSRVSTDFNIPYFDFSNDEHFSHDISLWSNSDHLNMEGKKKFTVLLNGLTVKEF